MPPYTRKAIEQSFLKLLNQRPLSQITVKDIVEDCNVNRNSFYYHFQDIPSLLAEVIRDRIDLMIDKIPEEFTLEEGMEIILNEIASNKKAFRHIWSSSNREYYSKSLIRACEYMIRRYVETRNYDISITDEKKELIISFLKFEVFGQIVCWLDDDMSFDLVEYGRKICTLFEEWLEYAILSAKK